MNASQARLSTLVLILLASLLSSCAVPPTKVSEQKVPIVVSPNTWTNPLHLARLVTRIPIGDKTVKLQYGWMCLPGPEMAWSGGRIAVPDEQLNEAFKQELAQSGYTVAGPSDSVFDDSQELQAELQVGGAITKIEANVCFPFSGSPTASIGSTNTVRGGMLMQITWELYSRSQGKVIHKTTTEGVFQAAENIGGGMQAMLIKTFTPNISNLLADTEFHRFVLTKPSSPMERPQRQPI